MAIAGLLFMCSNAVNWKVLSLLKEIVASSGQKQIQDNIVIATKFAAYPWRLTPGQFVNACKYALPSIAI